MHMKETPSRRPHLLPAFALVVCDGSDAFRQARLRAAAGGEAGDLLWVPDEDRLDCAAILVPDRPLEDVGLLQRLSLLALADALAAAAPPQHPVGVAPPGGLLVDGAQAGEVRVARVGAAAVVGVTVQAAGDESPGLHPERTALRDEGFEDFEIPDLIEAFGRHLVRWIDLWEHEGQAPLDRAWQARLALPGGAAP